MPPTKVTIAGHSLIKRLQQDFGNNVFPQNFGLREFRVNFVYKGGASVDSMHSMFHHIVSVNPQVVLLQIGGNDFTGDGACDHLDVPYNIIRLAKKIKQYRSVVAVYIGKLFYRDTHPKYLPSMEQVHRYNGKVDDINTILEGSAKALQECDIIIRNHKGRVLLREHILKSDGTHLNALGAKKFYRSIRGALIDAKRRLR